MLIEVASKVMNSPLAEEGQEIPMGKFEDLTKHDSPEKSQGYPGQQGSVASYYDTVN